MITVYEVPASKWQNIGTPSQKILDNCRVIASGDSVDWGQAIKELVAEINSDTVDTVNCYLYIKENEE